MTTKDQKRKHFQHITDAMLQGKSLTAIELYMSLTNTEKENFHDWLDYEAELDTSEQLEIRDRLETIPF